MVNLGSVSTTIFDLNVNTKEIIRTNNVLIVVLPSR